MSNHEELQKELEITFNKNQLYPRLEKYYKNEKSIQNLILFHGLDFGFALCFLMELAIHRRMKYSTCIGCCYYFYKDGQKTADSILECLAAGLANIDFNRGEVYVKYDIPSDMQTELNIFQFPLPLVVKPKKCISNRTNGYYISDTGSLVLNHRAPKYDINLEHLNRVNSVKLNLTDTMDKMPNIWKHATSNMSQKNHDKFVKNAQTIGNFYSDKSFYLTHKYDHRGRFYDVGYLINPQGNDWQKASVELAHKEKVKNDI